MKKKLIIVLMCAMFLAGCSIVKENKVTENNDKKVEIGKIHNLKESTKAIPDFTIVVRGITEATITDEDIKGLKLYDFETDVRKNDLDSNPEITHDTWTGVKLSDVLTLKKITEFEGINFKSTGNITIRYNKEELVDETYLIFYRNDILLSETEDTAIMLFVPSLKNRYWVPSLTRMDII